MVEEAIQSRFRRKKRDGKLFERLDWDLRGWWWRVAVTLSLLLMTLFPVYFLVVTSLKSKGEYSVNLMLPPLRGVMFENWLKVLPTLIQPTWNSTVIAVGSALLLLIIMTPCAYVFVWHRFPGKERLFAIAIATLLMPSVLTFVPLYIQVRDLGLLNTKWAMILPTIAGGVAVSLFLLRAFFSALPADLVEAARIDGASEIQILGRIIIPLATPGLITVAVLIISNAWNQYLWPLVALTAKSERVATVAAVFWSSDPFTNTSVPVLMSAYLLSSLPLIIILAILLKYFMAGSLGGALKG